MSNFIKDAQIELEHVVWPTPVENKKYMIYTVGVIITLTILLAILGYLLSHGLLIARGAFPHSDEITAPLTQSVSGESDTMTQAEMDKILAGLKTHTGTTASGVHMGSGMHTGSGILSGSLQR